MGTMITNVNGTSAHSNGIPGYCSDGIQTPYTGVKTRSWFGDVMGRTFPRDSISGVNGITTQLAHGDPFGNDCGWHPVRITGPHPTLEEACQWRGVAGAAETLAQGGAYYVFARSVKPLSPEYGGPPSVEMWFNTTSYWSLFEISPPPLSIPPVQSILPEGYYIVWGKYGVDNEGVEFKVMLMPGNSQNATEISEKGVCSL